MRDLDAERMARIDATARALFVAISPNGQTASTEGPSGADWAYDVAETLEDARERFLARRATTPREPSTP